MKRSVLGVLLVSALGLSAIACKGSSSSGPETPLPAPSDFVDTITSNPACALSCLATCPEATSPWVCPALGDWSAIPHADACAWDGVTFPPVTPGQCSASDPTGDALAPVSRTAPLVIPDGRRLVPAGTEWVFDEKDMPGGFPANALLIPGTKWLAIGDTGYDVQSLRVVDTTALRAGPTKTPVVSAVPHPQPDGFDYGLAWSSVANALYAPTNSGVAAFTLDTTTGALTADATKAITLPGGTLPQGLDVSPDGKTLIVGQMKASKLLVYSLDSATYGTQLASIDLGATDAFSVRFDPNDATGSTAYATMWTSDAKSDDSTAMRFVRVDVSKKLATTITVGKTPEEMAFISPRWAIVANALSDSLSIIDLVAANVAGTVQLGGVPGTEPTVLAWDAPRKRLYATLASRNAVEAYDVDPSQTPPTLTPAGAFSTSWWPTGLAIDPADGTLYVTNGKGHGTAPDEDDSTYLQGGNIGELMYGSVQAVPFMTTAALAAAASQVDAQNVVQSMAGYPSVQCNGAPYDFPIPAKIEDGRSATIKHVFFIVRENKTFDGIMGDVAGTDGDPSKVLAPGHMDEIWPNARAIAQSFSHMTNFYEDAEQSIQGHTWTVFGRSTDYDERRWLIIWGRGLLGPGSSPGVNDTTAPLEGSLFASLTAAGVQFEDDGELIDLQYRNFQWPGGTTEGTTPDTLGGCLLAARARVTCDLPEVTYAWFPNDHTSGLAAGWPNPAVMIATNDEGTGMLVDGLSRSPAWKDSLVIVVEDDPQDGSDHVDHHRSIALFASPWVKRHYASRAHYSIASVHKLISHIFGIPYHNRAIADAPLPLDLFTSTPDYSPFAYVPRKWADISCNPAHTAAAHVAERWDFSKPDDQPGLSEQVEEYLQHLPPHR